YTIPKLQPVCRLFEFEFESVTATISQLNSNTAAGSYTVVPDSNIEQQHCSLTFKLHQQQFSQIAVRTQG
ncbi:hypothetical protein Ccrd_024921, partial [Cynara cardunculus var. scolymus]